MSKQVNLSAIAETNNWHLASVISALQAEGCNRQDAEAFASFIFNHHAETTDCEASEYLAHDPSLWPRLELNLDGPDVEWMLSIPVTA